MGPGAMRPNELWKKKSGGLTNKLTEQRSSWLSPADTSRKAASVSDGKRKAGLKRRGN
jgi:hypothetical protein